MSPNRVVTILTPLVFAPLAGFISLQLAKLGVDLDTGTVQGGVVSGAVFLGGVIIAFLKSRKWLDGWQAWEKRQDWLANAALDQRFTAFLEELAEKTGVKLPGEDELPTVTGPNVDSDFEPPPPAFEPGAMDDSPRA